LKISNVQLQNAKSTGFSSGHQFREDPRLRLMPGFPPVGGKRKVFPPKGSPAIKVLPNTRRLLFLPGCILRFLFKGIHFG
jgi:hypothetical protein